MGGEWQGVDRQENRNTMKKTHLTELIRLAKQHGGEITPAQVVDVARNPDSPLHSWFEWDDTAAAEQWRLEQAKKLLRVVVTVIQHPTSGENITVRAFFSPRNEDDQGKAQRPYQPTVSMLQSKDGRRAILDTALEEFDRFQRKYEFLQELAKLFESARYLRGLKGGAK